MIHQPQMEESLQAEIAHLRGRLERAEKALRAGRNANGGPGGRATDGAESQHPDITLRENRERLELALAMSGMATFDFDLVHNRRTWNEGTHRLMGTRAETFTGTAEEFYQTIHPEDLHIVKAALARTLETLCDYESEFRVVWPDGSIHHISARGKIQFGAEGQPLRMTGVCWDVTARRHEQEAAQLAKEKEHQLLEELQVHQSELQKQNEELLTAHLRLDALREHYLDLFDLAPTGYVTVSTDGLLLEVNKTAAMLLGQTRHGLVKQPITRFIHCEDQDCYYFHRKRLLMTSQPQTCELRMVRQDGMFFWAHIESSRSLDEGGEPICRLVLSDITGRKKAEQELLRLNRTLRALNKSNRVLLLAQTESELLEQVSHIISQDCGHALVWIGFAQDDADRSVLPVASAGFEDGYLETVCISWADNERGRGPTGRAIRSGQPCQCTNMLSDPAFVPWRTEALKRGYASSLALPLLAADGRAFGSVTMYAREPGGVAENEVSLLRDLAGDLAYGITTLRLRDNHRRTEAALRESEARFRSTFHSAATPMALKNPDRSILEVNQAFSDMLGYAEPGMLVGRLDELIHPDDRPAISEAMRQLETREIAEFRMEKRYIHQQGHTVWCDASISVVWDPDGSVALFVVQAHDISARKHAEKALRHSEQYARNQWSEAEATLEGVPANIALLDADGFIVRVNRAWTAFASHNGVDPGSVAIGANYLAVCDAATGPEAPLAARFAAGIRSVMDGTNKRFSLEYPCHSPLFQRWFMGHVTAARGDSNARVVVAHVDVTQQKLIEEHVLLLNQELENRVHRRTRELHQTVEALRAEIPKRLQLEREILEISEREQCRLGQDLHDGIGQELAGIAMLGDVLTRQLQTQNEALATSAGKIASYIRSTIDSTRRLAKGLYPIELNRYGLLLALKDLADQTSHRYGVRCELRRGGETPPLAKSAEIHIYRIVQECLANAVKHGKPSHIIIESLDGEDSHTFTVTDDGTGFEKPAGATPGMGLYLMDYRARVIGAEVQVEKTDLGGCRVICRLPLNPAPGGASATS